MKRFKPQRNTFNLRTWAPALCLLAVALLLVTPTKAPPNCDKDGDGFLKAGGPCGGDDCNDKNAAINPGATEVCDGVDNNCDGTTDEGCGGGSPEICTDTIDNDLDGLTDCDDPDCSGDPACEAGGGTFTATATVTQVFVDGCIREDNYDLSGCTFDFGTEHRCTGVTHTSVPVNTCSPPGPDPDPGEVQTGLWDVSFWDTYPVVESTTTAATFVTREFEVSGLQYGSFTLNTNQYPKRKPNKLGTQGCFSLDDLGMQRTSSNPALPLAPGQKIEMACEHSLNPNTHLNLRKNGHTLAEHLLNPEAFSVVLTRDE